MLTPVRPHVRLVGLVAGCALLLLGCSTSADDSDTSGSPSESSSVASAPVSPTATSAGAPPASTPTAAPSPPVETPAEVITFVCGDPSLYQSGTAIYSDGTTGYEPSCDTYVPPTGSQDLNGDGVISGFERCGTACGEAPTSGEIQTRYGCEQGYITGPICDELGIPPR